jgi:type IV fimbrial biogenesis protein FimT
MHTIRHFRTVRTVCSGFSLLELMLVITVAAVILGLGIPNMRQFMLNNRMSAAANDVLTAVHTARAESVKRHAQVVMCFSADPTANVPSCNGAGAEGWVIFVDDKNPDVVDATDNNGVADASEPVLTRHTALPTSIGVSSKPAGNKGYVAFNSAGFARQTALGTSLSGMVLCDSRGNASVDGGDVSAARGLLISPTGRPQVIRSKAQITSNTALGGCP